MDGCSYGSKHKHHHDGLKGSRMHLLADEKVVCLKFLDGSCNRGNRCKFSHGVTRKRLPIEIYAVQRGDGWAEDWGDDVLEVQIWSVQVN